MKSSNRSLLLVGALALVVVPAGEANAQKALRYAENLAPRIVNPLFTTTMSEIRMNELIFDSLFAENYELQMGPSLVQDYVFKKGGTTMDLTLRSDIVWQDGTPLTAKDVVFSIHAYTNKRTLSPNARQVRFIKSATATGERSVHLVFVKPQDYPERKLDFKILPAHKFKSSYVKRSDPFKNRPIGTGPFTITHFGDDNSITLERNEYYPKKVSIPAIVMKEIPDKSQQANLLKYESLDLVVKVLPKDVAALEENRKIELYPYQTNSWWYIGFNLRNPILKDLRVRQAIAYSIDIEELLKPIGTGDIITGPYVKSSPYYNHDPSIKPAHLDLAKAEQLLTEAGFTRGAQYWERGGRPLQFKLSVPRNQDSAREVVLNLQTQLAKAGIKLDPNWENDASWKKKIWQDRSFDMVLAVWTFDAKEDIYEQFHSKGAKNFVSYKNPEVDKLLQEGIQTIDPQKRKQIYRTVHKILNHDLPYIFLWTLDSYSAISTRIQNVTIHPFAYFSFIDDWIMK